MALFSWIIPNEKKKNNNGARLFEIIKGSKYNRKNLIFRLPRVYVYTIIYLYIQWTFNPLSFVHRSPPAHPPAHILNL